MIVPDDVDHVGKNYLRERQVATDWFEAARTRSMELSKRS